MEGEELRQGKARVRAILIDPLERRGMKRKRNVSQDDHARFLDGLSARLAYMAEDRLAALAEVVERMATGKLQDIWPSEVTIINNARRLQAPPVSQSRLVRTYLQSAAGDAAEAGGYLVELMAYLKRVGNVPGQYAMDTIRKEADDNARMIERVTIERKQGRASPQDLRLMQDYMAALQLCLDIRAAKVKGEAA
ncbi:hypothetical protein [Pseudooceanicola sp. MF1-13]|uniref:hypothetical protein n=1 Tax=Pseudooceanicola sp. MF1-13 TaxID=3379095 RepID=UPI0038917A28